MAAKHLKVTVVFLILLLMASASAPSRTEGQLPPPNPIDFSPVGMDFTSEGSGDYYSVTVAVRYDRFGSIPALSVPCSLTVNGAPVDDGYLELMEHGPYPCETDWPQCDDECCEECYQCMRNILYLPYWDFCHCGNYANMYFNSVELHDGDSVRIKVDTYDLHAEWDEGNNELTLVVGEPVYPEENFDFEMLDVDLARTGPGLYDLTVRGGYSHYDSVDAVTLDYAVLVNSIPVVVDSMAFAQDVATPCNITYPHCDRDICDSWKDICIMVTSGPPNYCYWCACVTFWADPIESIPINDGDELTVILDPYFELDEWDEGNNQFTRVIGQPTYPPEQIDFEIADLDFELVGSNSYDVTLTVGYGHFGSVGDIALPYSMLLNGIPVVSDSIQFSFEVPHPCEESYPGCMEECDSDTYCRRVDLGHPTWESFCKCNKYVWVELISAYDLYDGDEINIILDPDDEVAEWDEANNEIMITMGQAVLPDEPIDFEPTEMVFIPESGSMYTVQLITKYSTLIPISPPSVPCSLYVNNIGVGFGPIGLDNVSPGPCNDQATFPGCWEDCENAGCDLYIFRMWPGIIWAMFCSCAAWTPFDFDPVGIGEGDIVSVKIDPFNEFDEWDETNNILNTSFTITSVTEPRFFTAKSFPNPFNPNIQIFYQMPATGNLAIKIYDVRGRLVRTLVDQVVTAGGTKLVWNGRDSRGREVSSGVYFWVARAFGETIIDKVALIK